MTWLLSLLGIFVTPTLVAGVLALGLAYVGLTTGGVATRAGRILLACAAAVVLVWAGWMTAGMTTRHVYKAETARVAAKLNAQISDLTTANTANQATISKLKAENVAWAAQAASSEARANKAAKDQAKAAEVSRQALAASQARLNEALHDKTNKVDLATVPLGPAVRRELCQHVTCTH